MNRIPFLDRNPQDAGPQYLEDLATGYWFSFSLFTAVEAGLFSILEPAGKSLDEIASGLGFAHEGTERFLNALCLMGILIGDGSKFFNSRLASEYLVRGKDNYQGDSILWRKDLLERWSGIKDCLKAGGRTVKGSEQEGPSVLSERRRKYILAMDSVAKTKVKEMLPLFECNPPKGEMLDVGTGSGAVAAGFLDRFASLRATLLDVPEVLGHARNFIRERGMEERAELVPANILDPWPVEKAHYGMVMLSNIIHAYSEKELPHILSEALKCLKEDGMLVIHDFFFEHTPDKAALFDLNMFINTYNGRVFSGRYVAEELERLKLHITGLIPLGSSDTAMLVASKKEEVLARLGIDKKARLAARIRGLGFKNVLSIPVGTIHIPGWTDMRCRFGCDRYGTLSCPPHAPSFEKTKRLINEFSSALLLEGEPPTREFQLRVLQAEKEAFKAGFYKAFSYWAGPCCLCNSCAEDGVCRNTKEARPSMEGAGIDVFETVRHAGLSLRTLSSKDDFVRYFGLILLE
jgi:predicted metal-binding protein/ubiquinone/menaquinone biosynthesis C-methylase UbiE